MKQWSNRSTVAVSSGATSPAGLSDASEGGAGFVALPELPPSLAQVVMFDRGPRPSFSRTAKLLGKLSDRDAMKVDDAMKQRRVVAHGYAVRTGLVTEEDARAIERERTLRVLVDQRHRGTSAFETWVGDVRKLDVPVEIVAMSAQDLAQEQRADGGGGGEEAGGTMLELARSIIQNLALMGASDAHFVRRANHLQVEARIKGDLRVIPSLTMQAAEGDQLLRALYTGLSTSREDFQQRDYQNSTINGYDAFPRTGLASVRVVRGPCYPVNDGGQFLIARLQPGEAIERPIGRAYEGPTKPAKPDVGVSLAARGFTPRQIELIDQLLRMPHGICFVTGPTGSGKTTLLDLLMRMQARLFPELRQLTMEDPVEYPKPWAIQLEAEGDDWNEILGHMLRMDPDIILIGEIRSEIEAIAALKAAMTGHFAWTTAHVNDAYDVFKRLEMLDYKRLSLQETCDASKVVGSIAQRLVKIVCPHCSKPAEQCDEEEFPRFMRTALKTWATDGDLSAVRLKGEGCSRCDGGTIGRRGVTEIVLTDDEFFDVALSKNMREARRWHRQRPGSDLSMLGNAMPLIFSGQASPVDVHGGVHRIVPKESL